MKVCFGTRVFKGIQGVCFEGLVWEVPFAGVCFGGLFWTVVESALVEVLFVGSVFVGLCWWVGLAGRV